jgi:CRISPR type III-A-associated RAMP protein Csm4
MITSAVYLRPRGPFSGLIGSDTLFGAMCWSLGTLGSDLDALFKTGPGFAVSQALPVRFGAAPQRFYPRPLTFDLAMNAAQALISKAAAAKKISAKKAFKEVAAAVKSLQQIGFFSEELFRQAAQGSLTPLQMVEEWLSANHATIRVGNLLMTSAEAQTWPVNISNIRTPLWGEAETQHNQIDRLAGATAEGLLFYETQIRFSDWGGFWVLVRAESQQALDQQVLPALRYLANSGLGGNRSTGYGSFDLLGPDPLPDLPQAGANANAWMALSRYLPEAGEAISGSPTAYRLTSLWPRREQKYPVSLPGQVTPPVYKRRLRIFEPGSVFPLSGDSPAWYGSLALLVGPDEGRTPVYQSGRAIPIRLYVPEGA